MTLHVLGVRHHSPACARLVAHVIAEVRPRFVLVEGPSDMNGRLAELALPHTLPIAIYGYADGERTHASFTPFCDYSPEWAALGAARAAGAEARFIDLPAWHAAFLAVENRYADRWSRAGERMVRLAERLGFEETDAVWDHLFEQPLPLDELRVRLATYFAELREGDDVLHRDREREAYMRRWIGWALAAGGDVVVVCGGYHAPALVGTAPGGPEPEVPASAELARTGSYLVPYSFRRLDAFVGYESGMPSPAFYQALWDEGAERGPETMLFGAIAHLRARGQPVSAADAIAALATAGGLARLRGHRALARCDVLDGLASALVKDALDAPLPWTRRGTLARGTDPRLVELVAAFSGTRVGALADDTPRPPLVADVRSELAAVGIAPGAPALLEARLDRPDGLARSRVLHRLAVLGIPGFALAREPALGRGGSLVEAWQVAATLEAEPALIEAAAFGPTLKAAAAAKLEASLDGATGLGPLARALGTAARIGIGSLALRFASRARRAASLETSLAALGEGLARLVALHEHDVIFEARGAPALAAAITAAFERGLDLLDAAADAGPAELAALVALRDATRTPLALDRERTRVVLARQAASGGPALRGAAVGFLWSLGAAVDTTEAAALVPDAAALANDAAALVTDAPALGDRLAGLFALARAEVLAAPALLTAIDAALAALPRAALLRELPALRLAFAWFPPRERARIAELVVGGAAAPGVLAPPVAPEAIAAGLALDAAVDRRAARWGL